MKGWHWIVLAALLGFLRQLFIADLTSWALSSLADVILRFHASRLPEPSAAEYLAEWRAVQRDIPENTRKLWEALHLFLGMGEVREEALSAQREAAESEHSGDVIIRIPAGTLGISVSLPPATLKISGHLSAELIPGSTGGGSSGPIPPMPFFNSTDNSALIAHHHAWRNKQARVAQMYYTTSPELWLNSSSASQGS